MRSTRPISRHAQRPSSQHTHAQRRSTTLAASSATLNDPAQLSQKTETNLSEDILVSVYYVRWSCVRNLLIVRTGGLPPSLRSCRLRPERLALQVLQEHAYDSNGNITCDPLRCFEIRYNLLNLATEVIGHDPEDTAAEGTLLCETVYYADGTRAGVTTPDDGYWTTRYIGSLIYEGEPGRETLEGIVTDVSSIFMQVDPMAEKYYGMTPYGYCAGNPVMMVDDLGSQPQSIAYEVVKTFSKKGIQHYLFLSVAPLCAPFECCSFSRWNGSW